MATRKPQPQMVDRVCELASCAVPFKARKVDVDRGWGRFHTKSCAAKARNMTNTIIVNTITEEQR